MKTSILSFILLFPFLLFSQFKSGEDVTISSTQNDDIYVAGEDININAAINGDAVAAGSYIVINDTIYQDLIIAAGDVFVRGFVADDIRAAGGKLTIDTEVGDDVVVAGGEVFITEKSIIRGNLINFSGTVQMNGEVKGLLKAYGGEIKVNGKVNEGATLYGGEIAINGEIRGTSKIVAESIEIGESAKFYGDVSYWSKDGEIDFKNSLIGANATFDEKLKPDQDGFSWKGFGIAALGFWIFYVLSAFLILLLLNWAFKNLFSNAASYLDKELLKSFGYGLLYVFGLPLAILITFMIIIGIPVGLFLLVFYLFSMLFGHLVAALLLAHYLNNRNQNSWNFWTLVFLALGIAIVLRLLTFIPFLGTLIALVVIAIGYGLLGYAWLQKRQKPILSVE